MKAICVFKLITYNSIHFSSSMEIYTFAFCAENKAIVFKELEAPSDF